MSIQQKMSTMSMVSVCVLLSSLHRVHLARDRMKTNAGVSSLTSVQENLALDPTTYVTLLQELVFV